MKNIFFISLLAFVLCSCGGKGYNPKGTEASHLSQEERDALIAAKKAEYADANNPFGDLSAYQGKLKLTALMTSNENLSTSDLKKLETKVLQITTTNGIGGMAGDPRYVLAVVPELKKKDVTSTAPVRHLAVYGLTFYVADIITGTVFESQEIEVKGVGDSDQLATIAAFEELKPNDARLSNMLQKAEDKIVTYYKEHGAEFIQQAEMMIAKQEYAQAMAILGSIPSEATEVYPQATKMMAEITPKYLAKESNLAMSQMKAALTKAQDGDFTEAMQYYALIPNDSPLKTEADKLVKEYKADANQKQVAKAEQERFNAKLQAKIQMTANRCLLDKYKKDAAYDRLPWLRKIFYLGDHDPFDGYTPEEGC